jgi:hypothetical protein
MRSMLHVSRIERSTLKVPRRRGLAALDYVLVLCVCLPMVTFTLWAGPRIMNLVYQMLCVLVSWPFM